MALSSLLSEGGALPPLALVVYLCFVPLVFLVRGFQPILGTAYGAVRARDQRIDGDEQRQREQVGRDRHERAHQKRQTAGD
mgnify:CR=1 FL=1